MVNLGKLPSELDYLAIMNALSSYKQPRDKLTKLLANGDLIRIKKGIYILGDIWRRSPFSKEILANIIYGPSYVSLEYALSWHRLIPERVGVVTSVTTGKNKQFDTPVGLFTYRHLNKAYFSEGITRQETKDGRGFLIASPGKALIDKIYFDCSAENIDDLKEYIENDLRVGDEELRSLDREEIGKITSVYAKKCVQILNSIMDKLI